MEVNDGRFIVFPCLWLLYDYIFRVDEFLKKFLEVFFSHF